MPDLNMNDAVHQKLYIFIIISRFLNTMSRASSPGTVGVKSSMIDDISLEDVETFEERRLVRYCTVLYRTVLYCTVLLARVKVRRKVSRVDSLKKFLMFGSRLAEVRASVSNTTKSN